MNPQERDQLITRLRSLAAAPPGLFHSSHCWEGRFVPVTHDWEIQGRGCFENIANQSYDQTPTESKDPNAFAVEISGHSMEPEFHARDWVVVAPNREPRNRDAVLVETLRRESVFQVVPALSPGGKKSFAWRARTPTTARWNSPSNKSYGFTRLMT